jgi:catechol 2,3-dioxygenase-like lactoylglutathione lyase family enzyme
MWFDHIQIKARGGPTTLEPSPTREAGMPITIERVDFVPVVTRDRARSKAFYCETLGLPLERDTPVGFEVRAGQVTLGVWEPERMGLPFEPNHNGITLRVPDVQEARSALEQEGIAFTGETIDTGVCHMAFLHDPDGNTIILHRRYAPV